MTLSVGCSVAGNCPSLGAFTGRVVQTELDLSDMHPVS